MTTKTRAPIRQGDVLILPAPDGIPHNATLVPRDKNRVILAYGEVTGHAHAILDTDCELFRTDDLADLADRFLRVTAEHGVALDHQEHDTLTIPPGDHIIRYQREYTAADMAPLRVAD